MQGIEILNRTPVMVEPKAYGFGLVLLVIALFVFLVLTAICFAEDYVVLGVFCAVVFASSFVGLLLYSNYRVESPDGRYRYEVTIDESVPLKDIYENYNIIEQDGKKWILEDKEEK